MSPPPSQTLGIDQGAIHLPSKFPSRHVQYTLPGVGGTQKPTNLSLATHSRPKRAGSVQTGPDATCLLSQRSVFRASYATSAKFAKLNASTSKATPTVSPKTTLVKPLPPPVAFKDAPPQPPRKRISGTSIDTGNMLAIVQEDTERQRREKLKAKMSETKASPVAPAAGSKSNEGQGSLGHSSPTRTRPASSAQEAALAKIVKIPAEEGATVLAKSRSSPTSDNTAKDPAVVSKAPTKEPPSVILSRAIPASKLPKTVAEIAEFIKEPNLSQELKPMDTKPAKPRRIPTHSQNVQSERREAAAREVAEHNAHQLELSARWEAQLSLTMKAEVRARRLQEEHEAQLRASERATYLQWKELIDSPATQAARIRRSENAASAFYNDRSVKLLARRKDIHVSHAASGKVMREINEPGILQQFRLIRVTHETIIELTDAIIKAYDKKAAWWEDQCRTQEAWLGAYKAKAHLSRKFTDLAQYYPRNRPELRSRRIQYEKLRDPFRPYWTTWDEISEQWEEKEETRKGTKSASQKSKGDESKGTKSSRFVLLENDIRKILRHFKKLQDVIVRPNGWFERRDVWRAMRGSLIDQELFRILHPFWNFRSKTAEFPHVLLSTRVFLTKEHPSEASRSPRFRTLYTQLEELNPTPYSVLNAVEEYEFAVYDLVEERAKLGLLDHETLKHWHVNKLRNMFYVENKLVRRGRSRQQVGMAKEMVAEPSNVEPSPRPSGTVNIRYGSTFYVRQTSSRGGESTSPVARQVSSSRTTISRVSSGPKPVVPGKAQKGRPEGVRSHGAGLNATPPSGGPPVVKHLDRSDRRNTRVIQKGMSDIHTAPRDTQTPVDTSKASATRPADRKQVTGSHKSQQSKVRREAEGPSLKTGQQTLPEGIVPTGAKSKATSRSERRKRAKARRLVSQEPRTAGTPDEASGNNGSRIWRKPVSESTSPGNSPGNDAVTSDVSREKPKSVRDSTSGTLNIRSSTKLQRAHFGTPLAYDYSAAPTVAYDPHLLSRCSTGCGEIDMFSEVRLDHQSFSKTKTEQDGDTNNATPKAAYLACTSKMTSGAVDTKTSKAPPSSDPPSGSEGPPSDNDGSHPGGSQGLNGDSEPSSSDPSDESSSDDPSEDGSETEPKEVHVPLSYQIPEATLRAAMLASSSGSVAYWSHGMYRGANGDKVTVHYCRSKEATEKVAKLFLDKSLLGFDIEWKPDSRDDHGIKNNVSLVQFACEDRIALFHIALHKGESREELVAPTLRTIMEAPSITKAGVSIRADCTRVRKFLGIEARGIFELSHLYRLVKFSTTNRNLVNKRLVSLAQQVEEHLQLPMDKGDVRQSDWSKELTYEQVMYAASDSYAAVHLFDVMERKRKELDPTPPRPAHAELNLPISLAIEVESSTEEALAVQEEKDDESVDLGKDAVGRGVSLDLGSERAGMGKGFDEPSETLENGTNVTPDSGVEVDGSALRLDTLANTLEGLSISDVRRPATLAAEDALGPISPLGAAKSWVSDFLSSRDPPHSGLRPRASAANLRAYYLWQHRNLNLAQIASYLRDPPLALSTVALYTLDAVRLEDLVYDRDRARRELLGHVKENVLKTRYRRILEEIHGN